MLKNIKVLFKANKSYLTAMFKNGKICILSQLFIVVLGIPLNLLQLYAPKFFIEEVCNNIPPIKALKWILFLISGELLFIFFSNVTNIIREYYCSNARLIVKEETYNHFLSLFMSYFDNTEKLNNIQRALSYGENGGTSFFMFITSILTSLTSFATLTFVSLSFDWWIWLVILFAFFLKVSIGNSIKKSVYQFQKDKVIRDRKISYYCSVLSNKNILPEIKVFGIADFFLKKHKETYIQDRNLQVKHNIKTMVLTILEQLPDKAIDVFAYIVIGIRLYNLEATLGDYTLFFSMLNQINSLLNNFKGIINSIAEHGLSAQNYLDFIDDNTQKIPISNNQIEIKNIEKISFENVSFKYDNQIFHAVKNFSFSISKGKKIGIVGLNGAGKSTLIKLLLQFYKTENGKIKINDINIEDIDINSLYKRVGAVFQNHNIYSLTLNENISFGKKHNDDKIWTILSEVGLDSKFQEFSEGLTKPITHSFFENGIDLSGGEKQKVAIARLLYKDCDLYILDEPSSSLDPKAENELYRLINSIPKDKIVIFISHHLVDMKLADEIIMLNNGKIAGIGKHSDLMNLCDEYRKLYNLQTKSYIETEMGECNE